jgi:heme exporter protein A
LSEIEVLLSARHLSAQRGQTILFEGVGFELARGHWLQVMGPNGVGKTTLLRMLCGLHPTTPQYVEDANSSAQALSEIRWKNAPITEVKSEFHDELIFLGHAAGLKEELSALENVLALCAIHGQALSTQKALSALQAVGLRGREHLPTRVLSQGQRRRVALARLWVQEATLWVLDEPFVALDGQGIELLLGLIEAHLRRGGALLFTSHQAVSFKAPGAVLELHA